MRSIHWLLLAAGCIAGCAHQLPLEDSVSNPPFSPERGIVFLFNGLTLSSEGNAGTGTYSLAQAIRRQGVRAEIDRPTGWRAAAEAVVRDERMRGAPIAIYGYSYGAQAALQFAEWLGGAGIPVQTVFLLEAFRPIPVPCNIHLSVHVYVSVGLLGQASPIAAEHPGCGEVSNRQVATLTTLTTQVSELNHWTVSRLYDVHLVALRDLLDAGRVRTRQAAHAPGLVPTETHAMISD